MIKKKNPQDATLRNINALKKRVKNLEDMLASLQTVVFKLLGCTITKVKK